MSLIISIIALIISAVALVNAIANYLWLHEWLATNDPPNSDQPDQPDEPGPPDLTVFEQGIAALLDDDQPGDE